MIGYCLRQLNPGSEGQKSEHNNICGVELTYFANYFSLGSMRYDNKYHYSLRDCSKNPNRDCFRKSEEQLVNKSFFLLVMHYLGGET